jgi:hypothetical protein
VAAKLEKEVSPTATASVEKEPTQRNFGISLVHLDPFTSSGFDFLHINYL